MKVAGKEAPWVHALTLRQLKALRDHALPYVKAKCEMQNRRFPKGCAQNRFGSSPNMHAMNSSIRSSASLVSCFEIKAIESGLG